MLDLIPILTEAEGARTLCDFRQRRMAALSLKTLTRRREAANRDSRSSPSAHALRPCAPTGEFVGNRPVKARSAGPGMVRWLDPKGLFVTGVDVVLSGLFGRYSDKRETQANLAGSVQRFLGDDDKAELWIDYVADLGDGWDATYSVASVLCRETLDVGGDPTRRGKILVMGGDEVYPAASYEGYGARLVDPYTRASASLSRGGAHLFVVPGNHDWYDGLTSFMRLFLSGEQFAAWDVPQTRTYFAVQLPHRWWLLGIDIAFDSYIDIHQLRFFNSLYGESEEDIRTGDNIILCAAKPGWAEKGLKGGARTRKGRHGRETLLAFERIILDEWGCELPLVISGDLHHYSRYESLSGARQRITSGGGGAYLYPTHPLTSPITWGTDAHAEELRAACRYPSEEVSKSLRWKIPTVTIRNWGFAVMAGVVYLLIATQMRGGVRVGGRTWYQSILEASPRDLVAPLFNRPLSGLLVTIMLVALILFADARRRPLAIGRIFMGAVHWGIHVAALVFCTYFALATMESLAELSPMEQPDLWWRGSAAIVIFGVSMFAYSAVAGGFVMAMYLFVAQMCKRHPNEAFAGLGLADYKGFVRMRLSDKGVLSIYSIGIDSVSHWDVSEMPDGELRLTGQPVVHHCVEGPIDLPPA